MFHKINRRWRSQAVVVAEAVLNFEERGRGTAREVRGPELVGQRRSRRRRHVGTDPSGLREENPNHRSSLAPLPVGASEGRLGATAL